AGISRRGRVVLATAASAEPPPAPSTITRTVIAAAKLPTVTDVPLHFRAVAVRIPRGEKSSASPGNSILYQLSGSTQILAGAETRTLRAAEGLFVAAGTPMVLNAGNDEASSFIQFFLVPAVDLDRPAASGPAAVTELFLHCPLLTSEPCS